MIAKLRATARRTEQTFVEDALGATALGIILVSVLHLPVLV